MLGLTNRRTGTGAKRTDWDDGGDWGLRPLTMAVVVRAEAVGYYLATIRRDLRFCQLAWNLWPSLTSQGLMALLE